MECGSWVRHSLARDGNSLCERQGEGKDRAATGFAARGDFSAMVFDDLFTNGKPEPCALGLAVGGEGLEKFVGDLGWNTGAGVLKFGDELVLMH